MSTRLLTYLSGLIVVGCRLRSISGLTGKRSTQRIACLRRRRACVGYFARRSLIGRPNDGESTTDGLMAPSGAYEASTWTPERVYFCLRFKARSGLPHRYRQRSGQPVLLCAVKVVSMLAGTSAAETLGPMRHLELSQQKWQVMERV